MRIAIVKLSALGDIVHAMVVLQFIKKNNKDIKIDWIVDENFSELLEFQPDINKVHKVELKKAKKKKSLALLVMNLYKVKKIGPYDIVIDMQGLVKSAIFSKLIPSKLTLGFDRTSARESFASFFYDKSFNIGYEENIVKRNFELIKFALNLPFDINHINRKLPFLVSHHKFIYPALSHTKKNVLLVPGASYPSKCYSVENFAKLPHFLDANYLIVWGNSEEKLIANSIKKISPDINICPKLSLENLISLISQVNLVIGSDTGPTHIAWAVNVPSLTLFGPTPGYRNTFTSKNHKILESESKVNPYKINKNDYSIKDIKLSDVVKISQSLLKLN